jgi:hypothetical protein
MYPCDLGIMKAVAPSLIHLNYVKKNDLDALDYDSKLDDLYQVMIHSQAGQDKARTASCDYDLCIDLGLDGFHRSE